MTNESAIVVTFPAMDPFVADLREVLDPASSWGVPAHVTVLYPFVEPEKLTSDVLRAIETLARETPRFEIQFARTAWFGKQVLWLVPEPDAPLRTLTDRLFSAFPQCPPYGGAIENPVPHLTVADGAHLPAMHVAESAVTARLPITTAATHLTVMTGRAEPNAWSVRATFPFDKVG